MRHAPSSLGPTGKQNSRHTTATSRRRLKDGYFHMTKSKQPAYVSPLSADATGSGRYAKPGDLLNLDMMRDVASQPYDVREALKIPTGYTGDLAAGFEECLRDLSAISRWFQDFRVLPSSGVASLPLMPIDLTFRRSLADMDFSHYPSPQRFGLDPQEFEALRQWDWNLPSAVSSFHFPWNEDSALFWRFEGFLMLLRLLTGRDWDAELERELKIRTERVRCRR